MLKKQFVKSREVTKVTFELARKEIPNDISADSVHLVGEFNDWDQSETPMTYSKNKKAFWVAVDLEPGRRYQFRYLVNGGYWCNDWEADEYVPGAFGQDNSVVETPPLIDPE